MIVLRPVGGAPSAFGNAVNDYGQVVGNENNGSNEEVMAALWTADGRGYDLNELVAPSHFQMVSADYIDDKGDIVGHGSYVNGPNSGNERIFLLVRNRTVRLPTVSRPAAEQLWCLGFDRPCRRHVTTARRRVPVAEPARFSRLIHVHVMTEILPHAQYNP
jgi:hypothetical protein